MSATWRTRGWGTRAMWLALLTAGCEGKKPRPDAATAAPTAATASVAPKAPARPAAPPPVAASTPPAPSVAPPPKPQTAASLIASAEKDRAAFDKKPITFDAYFDEVRQMRFGTRGHPSHYFAIVWFKLEKDAPDRLECWFREHTWPPLDLKPGDPIRVKGRWSFDALLPGGLRPGAGKLHVGGCFAERRK